MTFRILASVVTLMVALSGRVSAAPATRPTTAPSTQPAESDWAFIQNEHLRLGVKKSSGAAIAWLSRADKGSNLLNHFDRGRLVQQSYYGMADGSDWNGKKWLWNPVQGGDWKGGGSRVAELRVEGSKLYARTIPRHWGRGEELADVSMEQWIELTGETAHVRFRMSYSGKQSHPVRDQETPAFFAEPEFGTLVLYDGDRPWSGARERRWQPGWPNERHRMTENWAAYVDENDFGVGAYVPAARELTCYRYRGGGNSNCSYFAPLMRFAITPGLVFEYDLYLAVGSSRQIRQAFEQIHERPQTAPAQTSPPAPAPLAPATRPAAGADPLGAAHVWGVRGLQARNLVP